MAKAKKNIKVAILTPIYKLDDNIIKSLKETDTYLRSVSNNNTTFTWVFFVNNALISFNKFENTIKSECTYSKIKFVNMLSEPYTLGMCRNFAARYAWVNGYDYMTYLDSDDSLDVRFPSEVFDNNPDVIMFTSHRRNSVGSSTISSISKETMDEINKLRKEQSYTLPEALMYMWVRSRGIYQYPWNLIISTKYFNRNNISFGDQFVFEDVKAFVELLTNNPNIRMIKLSSPCYIRNVCENSVSNTVSDKFEKGLVSCGKYLLNIDSGMTKFLNLCNYAKIKGIKDNNLDSICMEVTGMTYESLVRSSTDE